MGGLCRALTLLGQPSDEELRTFCTTPENYHDRLEGFSVNDLPKTFQDAVRVTRTLGKKYLWIDAICIIQGPGGDWKTEARKMEDVFACAFVTIAATSARGWQEGFLTPEMTGKAQGVPRGKSVRVTLIRSWMAEHLGRELGFFRNGSYRDGRSISL